MWLHFFDIQVACAHARIFFDTMCVGCLTVVNCYNRDLYIEACSVLMYGAAVLVIEWNFVSWRWLAGLDCELRRSTGRALLVTLKPRPSNGSQRVLLILVENGRGVKTYGVNYYKIHNTMNNTLISFIIFAIHFYCVVGDLEFYPGKSFSDICGRNYSVLCVCCWSVLWAGIILD